MKNDMIKVGMADEEFKIIIRAFIQIIQDSETKESAIEKIEKIIEL